MFGSVTVYRHQLLALRIALGLRALFAGNSRVLRLESYEDIGHSLLDTREGCQPLSLRAELRRAIARGALLWDCAAHYVLQDSSHVFPASP